MFRSLWRWLTYKRVLLVYDGAYVADETMLEVRKSLDQMRVRAVILCVYGNRNQFEVYALDRLKPTEFGWLKAMVDEIASRPLHATFKQPSPEDVSHTFSADTVIDPKELL